MKEILKCPECELIVLESDEVCPFCGYDLKGSHTHQPHPASAPASAVYDGAGHTRKIDPPQDSWDAYQPKPMPVNHDRKTQQFNQTDAENTKKGKSGLVFKIIAALCLVVALAIGIVGGKLGIFKENDGDKTIILSSLNKEQTQSFEQYIKQYYPVFEKGFDCEKTSFDQFLEMLEPYKKSGLYQACGGSCQTILQTDPAKRFELSSAVAGYVEIDESKIEELASSMSISAVHGAISNDYYYYNGKYYFVSKEDTTEQTMLFAHVDSSKKTSTDDYYIECSIYRDENALTSPNDYAELYKRYILVSMTEKNEGLSWTIKCISDKPMYSSTGEKTEAQPDENSLDYTLEKKKISAKTSDGVHFATYYVEYPKFEASVSAAASLKSTYEQKIAEFTQNKNNVDELYKAFKEDGGTDDMLPFYTNVIASVTYNENNLFSVIEKTVDYNPLKNSSADTQTTEQTSSYYSSESETEPSTEAVARDVAIILPTVSFEGNTFNIKTGEIIKKEALLGADTDKISRELYNTYSQKSVSNEDGLGSETNSYEPSYSNNSTIGTDIYNSAWSLKSIEGNYEMDFYYVDGDGKISVVPVPSSELNDIDVSAQPSAVEQNSVESNSTVSNAVEPSSTIS